MIVFDETYYRRVIGEYGYDPLDFQPINFALRGLDAEVLKKKWLCHHEGNAFAVGLHSGAKCIVTTGFGLSGTPHVGTISQMLGAILLQRAGLRVQIVLGDLDSYNARNQPLNVVKERASQYAEFVTRLGFDSRQGILRTQVDYLDVLLTAYLIANCLTDGDFKHAEEDLSQLYQQRGIYPGIEFPVKLATLLMTADFMHLGNEYDYVLVMLGLDEHRYIQLAKKVVTRMHLKMSIAGIYSRMNKGLSGYPKMSKSIPGSAITADMNPDIIKDSILNHEGPYATPMDSVVYQMMCSTSYYTPGELDLLYQTCQAGGALWQKRKAEYGDMLIEICSRWPQ